MDDQDTISIKDDAETLSSLSRLTPAVVAAIVGIGLGFALLQNRVSGIGILHMTAWLFLVFSTLITFIEWCLDPQRNLAILVRWFRERHHSTYSPELEQLAGVGLMVIMGALFVTAFWPLYYSIIFMLYTIVYFLGVNQVLRTVRLALKHTRVGLRDGPVIDSKSVEILSVYDAAYKEIKRYHFKNKHLWRIGLLLVAGIVAFALALADRFGLVPFGAESAAFLMGGSLLGMEVLISIWRNSYYRQEAILNSRRKRLEALQ